MLKMSESGLQEFFSACKCNDSGMEKHVPSFINYSLLFVFVVGEKSNHPLVMYLKVYCKTQFKLWYRF